MIEMPKQRPLWVDLVVKRENIDKCKGRKRKNIKQSVNNGIVLSLNVLCLLNIIQVEFNLPTYFSSAFLEFVLK